MNEAEALAKSDRGAMVAAAGCGKTHVIATAVADYNGGRELILTHTHAGVDAIRARLVKLGVAEKSCRVNTIAGWALRLATAFPRSSALPNAKPRDNADYCGVYAAATRLLELRPIREIVRASYSGMYVDEYQDCTLEQHGLVVKLLEILPCRIVGDPLQGIFDFGDNKPIRWDDHVRTTFHEVKGPTTPWRWSKSNPVLGEWLMDVRARLATNGDVDLRHAPVQWLDCFDPKTMKAKQLAACFDRVGKRGETVIAIHQWPNQCHSVASCLKGIYSCIEPVDTDDLYRFAQLIDTTTGFARAVAVLDFAGKCITMFRT